MILTIVYDPNFFSSLSNSTQCVLFKANGSDSFSLLNPPEIVVKEELVMQIRPERKPNSFPVRTDIRGIL